jgi:hypothetical protein
MGAIGIKVNKTTEIAPALKESQSLNKQGKTVLIEITANIEHRRSTF